MQTAGSCLGTGALIWGTGPAGGVTPFGVTLAAISASVMALQVAYLGSLGVADSRSRNENGRRIVLKPSSCMRHTTFTKSATMASSTLPHRPSGLVCPFS